MLDYNRPQGGVALYNGVSQASLSLIDEDVPFKPR